MIQYLLLTIIVISFSFLDITNWKRNKGVYVLIFFPLFVIAGFRAFTVGGDTLTYKQWFDWVQSFNIYMQTEPLFAFWISLVSRLTHQNYIIFLVLTAFISIVIKFRFFANKLPLFFIPVLVYYSDYYYIAEFNQMRQGLAFGICLYAFSSYIEGNSKKYYILTVIASLIHFSSLLVFLTPLFVKIRRIPSLVIFLIVLILFCLPLFNLNSIVVQAVTEIVNIIPIELLQNKLKGYLDSNQYNIALGIGFRAILYLVEVALFLYYKERMKSERFNKWLALFIVGVCIYYPLLSFEGMLRLTTTFCFLSLVLYSYVINFEKNKVTKLGVYIFLVLTSLIKILGFVKSDVFNQYLPYHFSI